MRRGAVIAVLRAHEAELQWLGVQRLFVFGSTVRDEAHDVSDVDLIFDHPEGSMGLFGLMEVKDVANRILGYRADILTRRSLHPVLRSGIEASAQQIF